MITEKLITDAWVFLRTNNNSIPDDVLDFIKESSLAALRLQNSGNTNVLRSLELLQSIAEKQIQFMQPGMAAFQIIDASDNLRHLAAVKKLIEDSQPMT